jgi:beta-aspartyl-peptidase (threonine type)
MPGQFTIAIHGGAGTILRREMTAEKEQQYREALLRALEAGHRLLRSGSDAVAAVLAAVTVLEDDPLFNAGRGSVFTKDGRQEMDACIMDGSDLNAGAVAAVRNVRNPILLAEAVMRKSPHVMLIGEGAEIFARLQGLAFEEDKYFYSEHRYRQWQQVQQTGGTALDHDVKLDKKFGTVGAVARDANGNLAAATSTGGMTNKEFGRVGDSPIIGAGNYANNQTCAISCTGHGEPFIRAVTAYDVSCLMEYRNLSLKEAMRIVVHEKLPRLEGEGGMIGVDREGNAELMFNSEGMYRGCQKETGPAVISIYKENE